VAIVCVVFVANFTSFPAVQEFWKSVKISQSYREFKGRKFFETQCILLIAQVACVQNAFLPQAGKQRIAKSGCHRWANLPHTCIQIRLSFGICWYCACL